MGAATDSGRCCPDSADRWRFQELPSPLCSYPDFQQALWLAPALKSRVPSLRKCHYSNNLTMSKAYSIYLLETDFPGPYVLRGHCIRCNSREFPGNILVVAAFCLSEQLIIKYDCFSAYEVSN